MVVVLVYILISFKTAAMLEKGLRKERVQAKAFVPLSSFSVHLVAVNL